MFKQLCILLACAAVIGPALSQDQNGLAPTFVSDGLKHTWIVVCPLEMIPSDCDLTTAYHWYQLAQAQPSSFSPAIRAAEKKVKPSVPTGFYMKLDQFPVGQSMGTDSYVFFACGFQGLDPATPSDMAKIAKNGTCLK